MSVTLRSIQRQPIHVALAALAPIALGGIVALRAGQPSAIVAVPAIVFGVVAATAPALYIASAVTAASGGNRAPTIAGTARAIAIALGAFGIALAGFVLPAAFLALTTTSNSTTPIIATAALGGAGLVALRRLGRELHTAAAPPASTIAPRVVFAVWSIATMVIAARLWLEFTQEVFA